MQEFHWAQDKINALTATEQQERHEAQINEAQQVLQHHNRAQRREIERLERRLQKQMAKP